MITYDFAFIGRSKILRAFEAKSIVPNIVLNAIDADVIKTYVESGLGIAIVPEMAYERARDRTLRCLDAITFRSSRTRYTLASGAITTCVAICIHSSRCSPRT
ncbi:MAG: hypothetical protein KIT18_01310 [Burkholderiales bacterium]|nr:hypothetical protein [Burkholderiales bacterium]